MLKKPSDKQKNEKIQHLDFNRASVASSRLTCLNQEYGYKKVCNTGTPHPKKHEVLNTQQLFRELKAASVNDSTSPSLDTGSASNMSTSSEISFQMKRKLFHEGEFTITRGKKTSEMHHPDNTYSNNTLPKKSIFASDAKALKEIEDYARVMDIKISKDYH